MSTTYTTIQGDMVDAIAYRKYGRTAGVTEAIFAANQNLAEYGPILPDGVVIVLPDDVQTSTAPRTKLWQ